MLTIFFSYISLFNLFNILSIGLVTGKSLSEQIAELQKDDMNEINGTLKPTSYHTSDNDFKDRDEIFYNQYLKEDPLQNILPKVRFNCSGRPESYYADPDFNCEVFHYCKTNGFRFTFICPPKSIFDQKRMTCDYDKPKEEICQSSNSSNFDNHSSKRINPQWLTGEEEFSKDSSSVNSVNNLVKKYPDEETSIDANTPSITKFTQYSDQNDKPKTYLDSKPATNDDKSILYSTYDYTESSLYSDNEDENDQNQNDGINDSYDQNEQEFTPPSDEKNFVNEGFKPILNDQKAKRYTTLSTPVFEIKAESVGQNKLSTPSSVSSTYTTTFHSNVFKPSNIQTFGSIVGHFPAMSTAEYSKRDNLKVVKPNTSQINDFSNVFTNKVFNQKDERKFTIINPTNNKKMNSEIKSSFNLENHYQDKSQETFIPMYSNSKNYPSIQYSNNQHNYPIYNKNIPNQHHPQNIFNNYDNKRYNNDKQQPGYYQQNYNQIQTSNIKPWVNYDEPNIKTQVNNVQLNGHQHIIPKFNGHLQTGPQFVNHPNNNQVKSNFNFKYNKNNLHGSNSVYNSKPHYQAHDQLPPNYPFKFLNIEPFSEEEDHKYPDLFFGLPKISPQNRSPLKYDQLIATEQSNLIPFSIPFDNRPYFAEQSPISNSFPFLTWLRPKNIENFATSSGFLASASNNENRLAFAPLFDAAPSIPQPRRIPFFSTLSKLFLSSLKPNHIPFYQMYNKNLEQLEYPVFSANFKATRSPFNNINFLQNQRLIPVDYANYADSPEPVLTSPFFDSLNNQTWDDNYATSSQFEPILSSNILKFKNFFPYSDFSVRSSSDNVTFGKKNFWAPVYNHSKRNKRSIKKIKKRMAPIPYSSELFTLNDFPFLTSFNDKMFFHPIRLASAVNPSFAFPTFQTPINFLRLSKLMQDRYLKSLYVQNLGYSIPLSLNLYPIFNVPFAEFVKPFSSSNFKNKFTVKTRYVPSFGKTTFLDPEFGPISVYMNELSDFGSQIYSVSSDTRTFNDSDEEPKFKHITIHKNVYKRPPKRKKTPDQDTEFEIKTWPYWFNDKHNNVKDKEKQEKVKVTMPKLNYYENSIDPKKNLYDSNFDSYKKLPYSNQIIPNHVKTNLKTPEFNKTETHSYNDIYYSDIINYNSDFSSEFNLNGYLSRPPLFQNNNNDENKFSNQNYVNHQHEIKLDQKIIPNDDVLSNNTSPTSTFVYTSINSSYSYKPNIEREQNFKNQNSTLINKLNSELNKIPNKYKPSAYSHKQDLRATSTFPSVPELFINNKISPAPSMEEMNNFNLKSYGTRLSSLNKMPTFNNQKSYSIISTQSNLDTNETNREVDLVKKKLIENQKNRQEYKKQENEQALESNYMIFKPSAYASKNLKSKIKYQGAGIFKPKVYQSSFLTFNNYSSPHQDLFQNISTSFEIGLNQKLKNHSTQEVTTFLPLTTSIKTLISSIENVTNSSQY